MTTSVIWKLKNSIQHYAWGSKTLLATHFNIANPNHEPQAEIWMGAHQNGCSIAIDNQEQPINLAALIATNCQFFLGSKTCQSTSTLPYLMKVLAIEKPLSIQVHPNKVKAEAGFNQENTLGIPLDAPNRNFKDANHKPELTYALTPFYAMNGFRVVNDIITLFNEYYCDALMPELQQFIDHPTPTGLKQFFTALLLLNNDRKAQAIMQLTQKINGKCDELAILIKQLITDYPNDIGVFSPLFLNVILLNPGEAMFLNEETPHAYLRGMAIEVMANSDNVLRAGLTGKYIDINALIENTQFVTKEKLTLKLVAKQDNNHSYFPIPVNDFKFEIINSDKQVQTNPATSAEILFCFSGEVTITTTEQILTIKKGESLFIAANAQHYCYQGKGKFARVFN